MLKFVHQAIRNIRTTGSVVPSSPMLAKEMTRSLRGHRGEKRVLEVGAGTGAFTSAVLLALRGHDQLDIVEMNPAFCEHLEVRLLQAFRRRHPAIKIQLHAQPIERAQLVGGYDFVVCGLPFNNFPPALTDVIFKRMLSLMRDGAELTYFEYAGLGAIRSPFVGSAGRERIRGHQAIKHATARDHRVTRHLVLANFPPAHAVRIVKRR
ncbi:MAG: methyltransferase domain-containing protein [Phycisphaerales bacterium]|nr:methyltransferase domain-containing protein [Phycisphaerales bacterium]